MPENESISMTSYFLVAEIADISCHAESAIIDCTLHNSLTQAKEEMKHRKNNRSNNVILFKVSGY